MPRRPKSRSQPAIVKVVVAEPTNASAPKPATPETVATRPRTFIATPSRVVGRRSTNRLLGATFESSGTALTQASSPTFIANSTRSPNFRPIGPSPWPTNKPHALAAVAAWRPTMPAGALQHVRPASTGYSAPMGFLRRKKTAGFGTGHSGDDQLLAQLSQMSDLSTPRHWVHYLYFANEAAARGAAPTIAAADWDLQQVAESAAGGPEWVVIAERHRAITSPKAVREARLLFERVAAQWPGGDYDGWEASA